MLKSIKVKAQPNLKYFVVTYQRIYFVQTFFQIQIQCIRLAFSDISVEYLTAPDFIM